MTRTGGREGKLISGEILLSEAHRGQESFLQADYPQELSEDRVPSGRYLSDRPRAQFRVVDLGNIKKLLWDLM